MLKLMMNNPNPNGPPPPLNPSLFAYSNTETSSTDDLPLEMMGVYNFGAFEPVPIGAPRSRQQAAASSALLRETVRLLFHDNHGTTNTATNTVASLNRNVASLPSLSSPHHATTTNTSPFFKNEENTIHPTTRFLAESHSSGNQLLDETTMYTTKRFQTHQSDKWESQFYLLQEFRQKHGHCRIPHTYPENQSLARWVKRQRYQYKQKLMGEKTTMTARRVQALEEIGFIWDSHVASWEQRMSELMEYREKYGNCQVPTHYEDNKQLAIWVKCQRRQFKLFKQGLPSTLTRERIQELDQVGFEWKAKRLIGKQENNQV